MTVPPGTKSAPPRPAAKTVSLSAAPTRPDLPAIPAAPPAGATSPGHWRGPGQAAPAQPQAYSLLLPCKSGAVFFQHGRARVLPVFTGWDEAAAFLVSARLTRCWIIELSTTAALTDFLQTPPGRSGAGEFLVSVDPSDLMNLAAALFPARDVIKALSTGP